MRKLFGIVAVLALTALAATPSEAVYPGNFRCLEPSDCPDFIDCYVTDCLNKRCVYDCWW